MERLEGQPPVALTPEEHGGSFSHGEGQGKVEKLWIISLSRWTLASLSSVMCKPVLW